MEDSYKSRSLDTARQLSHYIGRVYSRLRSVGDEINSHVRRTYASLFSGSSTYGNSNAPANGGYDPKLDYERERRRSDIFSVTG
jgi:hypothetical protein